MWNGGQDGRVEDPELTSSQRHTKIATIYRIIIDEKDQKTSRKNLLQLKITEGTTIRQVGGAKTWYIQNHNPGGQPTDGKTITVAEVLSKE